jgi:hypothetical protein
MKVHKFYILCFLFFVLTQTNKAQNFSNGFNFVLPAFDSTYSEFLPDFPKKAITNKDRVITKNGDFYINKKRIKFWGVNVGGASAFPAKDKAPQIAARMRKMGINLVRLHGLENTYGGDNGSLIKYYTGSGTSRILNPETLDRLCFFIAELKKQGIYVNLNLHVGRIFKSVDGVVDADSILNQGIGEMALAKGITLFDPWLRYLQKEYAKQFLGHINPYTGMALGKDPVVAMVEMNNENNLYTAAKNGWLKPIAEGGGLTYRHTAMLDEQWNTFLKERYLSQNDLKKAWNEGVIASESSEIFQNGGFEAGNTNWQLEIHDASQATFQTDNTNPYSGRTSGRVNVTQTSAADWHLQFEQVGFSLEKNVTYTLSFAARADRVSRISAGVLRHNAPYTGYAYREFDVNTQWQTFSYTFTPTEDNMSDGRLSLSFLQNKGVYWFDAVSLKKSVTPPSVFPELLQNTGFETGRFELPWSLELHEAAEVTMKMDTVNPYRGRYSAKMTTTNGSTAGWHIQLKQTGFSLQKDSLYTLSFAARADQDMTLGTGVIRDNDPYNGYGFQNFNLTTQWQVYHLTFQATEDNNGFGRVTFSPNQLISAVWLDDVSLRKASPQGLLEGEELFGNNIRRIDWTERFQFSDNRVGDLAEFYIETQKRHFDDLYAYLHRELGITAPITGTNQLQGPANVLHSKDLDYIDDHSYWDHPRWTGQAWDNQNWVINNTPLVKDFNLTALTNIFAGLRMANKPHTISEYNHGMPNRYRSEMPITFTAYSSLHGCDAVMFYDYNNWQNDWESDFVSNYFALGRDHSIMSQFPACAFAFRNNWVAEDSDPINIAYNREHFRKAPKYTEKSQWDMGIPYDTRLALQHSIQITDFDAPQTTNFSQLPTLQDPQVTTATGETTLDTEGGFIQTATPKYVALAGFLDNKYNANVGDLRLVSADQFGSISWVATDSKTLYSSRRSLLTINTRQQNTNMVWQNDNTSIGNQWGTAPTEQAPMKTQIQLHIAANYLELVRLNAQGQPVSQTTVMPTSSQVFTIDINQQTDKTLWYGIRAFGNGFGAAMADDLVEKPKNTEGGTDFTVFPNPASKTDVLTVQYTLNKTSVVRLDWLNTLGQVVKSDDLGLLTEGEQWKQVALPNVPTGTYFVALHIDGQVGKMQRMVIK